MEKIGAGVIGLGTMGPTHAKWYALMPEVELKAVCDTVESRAKRVAAEYNVDWYVDYRELLERRDIDAVDIVIIDLQRVGGVTEWMKVAAIAEAWNLPVASHLFNDFSAHLIAAIPNGLIVEYMPWWDEIYEEPPQVVEGSLKISDKPGVGLQLNRSALKKYEMT